MSVNDLVLVQGIRDTRGALARWNGDPWPVLRSWTLGAVGVSVALLVAVWVVATQATPDSTPISLAGLTYAPGPGDVVSVLFRNSLVLALHATACVAGFIAGSSLPLSAAQRTGFSRVVHEKARPLAFAWVVAVTCFSLVDPGLRARIHRRHAGRAARHLARDRWSSRCCPTRCPS